MPRAKFEIGKSARHASADGGVPSDATERASWNTIQPDAKPKQSYARRMTLAFAATAVMTAVIFLLVLAVVWENQFQTYTRQNMQSLAQATASTLAAKYEEAGGWTPEVLSYAEMASNTSADIAVQVQNSGGVTIYDDTWIHGKSVEAPSTEVPSGTDSIVTASITLSSGQIVGNVRLWAFGSDAMLTSTDSAFRTNSYTAICIAAVIAVIFSCIIGVVMSRSLAKPIGKITATARQIRNGDLSARTGLKGSDEIGQLGETFDDMATSLEKDIKHERRLTSDVAHELRTPLMAMQATVEAMQDGVYPTDAEHLEVIATEVRRLSRLVGAMLQLSRLENGKTPFHPEETDLVWLVKSLVTSQEQLFQDKDLQLRFADETPNQVLVAEVDPDLIRQAVVNLMSNAMRYTPAGGWVLVAINQDHSDALISVSDTGIGIAKEDLPRTFSRFWRSDASREMESGGLGVGLAVTKEIIDRHNGTITVESELGKGTTFTLRIPLHRKPALPLAHQGAEHRD